MAYKPVAKALSSPRIPNDDRGLRPDARKQPTVGRDCGITGFNDTRVEVSDEFAALHVENLHGV
jgi:hypothetical protein